MFGSTKIKTPRNRDASFKPIIVEKKEFVKDVNKIYQVPNTKVAESLVESVRG